MLAHCAASSLVGVRTSARVAASDEPLLPPLPLPAAPPRPPPRCSIRSMSGRRNAAVLPLPVTADAQTSRPAMATGRTEACMGVGVTKPMEATPRRRGRERPSCAKVSTPSSDDATRDEAK